MWVWLGKSGRGNASSFLDLPGERGEGVGGGGAVPIIPPQVYQQLHAA
jgi:hypothetical protein